MHVYYESRRPSWRSMALSAEHPEECARRRHAHREVGRIEVVPRLDLAPFVNLVLLADARGGARGLRADAPASPRRAGHRSIQR